MKVLNKLGVERPYHYIIKAFMTKASITLDGEKLKSISSNIRNKTRVVQCHCSFSVQD
jgi:hypothetical protein